MFSKELGSKLIYLQELQDLVGQQKEVLVQESRLSESDSAIAALQETRSKTVAEYEHGLLDDLAKAEQKAAGLAQDVIKAEQRTSLQKLTAPVDGVVQQLAVHTVGGVVTPAQQLMVIVPTESQLEIEAMISNRDVGFVEAGQEAAIKVDTFNFTRYGLLQGTVLSVSNDAIQRDRPQDKQPDKPQAAETGSSEPKGQELVYCRARLARPHAHAGRGQDRQPVARHGGHRRDQDRLAQHPELPAVAARPLQARQPARALRPPHFGRENARKSRMLWANYRIQSFARLGDALFLRCGSERTGHEARSKVGNSWRLSIRSEQRRWRSSVPGTSCGQGTLFCNNQRLSSGDHGDDRPDE